MSIKEHKRRFLLTHTRNKTELKQQKLKKKIESVRLHLKKECR